MYDVFITTYKYVNKLVCNCCQCFCIALIGNNDLHVNLYSYVLGANKIQEMELIAVSCMYIM